MEILLFKFNKKANSTKVPNDSDGVTVHVDVKQNVMGGREGFSKDCFVVTPTFFISATSGLTPDKANCYNYCKAFGRYYFIRNPMVDISNAITLFCEIDALATLKTEILATNARVLYSTSHGSLQIDDGRNGPAANTELDWEIENMFDQMQSFGTYILNVIGYTDLSSGHLNPTPFSVTYILRDLATATTLANALLDPNVLTSLMAYTNNAQDFIVNLKWTPIELPDSLSSVADVYLGPVDVHALARSANVRYYMLSSIPLNVPHRYSDYRQSSKYVDYTLHIPYCGSVKIPVSILKNESQIYITPVLDITTGDLVVRITNSSNALINILS